jgi:hypothetical protein
MMDIEIEGIGDWCVHVVLLNRGEEINFMAATNMRFHRFGNFFNV